jgi:AAA15 family ATPase/GTPase
MLIRFICRNVLSFYDEIDFRLFPGTPRKNKDHIIHTPGKNPDVLKACLIYGANASGKSNLVKAVDIGKRFILNGPINQDVVTFPRFKMKKESVQEDSMVEFTFYSGEKVFVYGYEVGVQSVKEEWCYQLINRKPKLIFQRITEDNRLVKVKLSLNLNEEKGIEFNQAYLETGTPHNQLCLTTIMKSFAPNYSEITGWFAYKLKIIYPNTKFLNVFNILTDEEFYQFVRSMLSKLDTGISNLTKRSYNFDDAGVNLPPKMKDDIRRTIRESGVILVRGLTSGRELYAVSMKNGVIKADKIVFSHQIPGEELIDFDLGEESDGTGRLLDLLPILYDIKNNDSVYLIDEIERSLHTVLIRGLFKEYFNFKGTNHSQLIATTHDTNLLDLRLFRRDEFWFIKKNYLHTSELYSLEEFKERFDKQIARDYLSGRYGAIPVIDLFKEE